MFKTGGYAVSSNAYNARLLNCGQSSSINSDKLDAPEWSLTARNVSELCISMFHEDVVLFLLHRDYTSLINANSHWQFTEERIDLALSKSESLLSLTED